MSRSEEPRGRRGVAVERAFNSELTPKKRTVTVLCCPLDSLLITPPGSFLEPRHCSTCSVREDLRWLATTWSERELKAVLTQFCFSFYRKIPMKRRVKFALYASHQNGKRMGKYPDDIG